MGQKLANINRDNHEDQHRIFRVRNTNSPRIQGDYVFQVSEEIECRETKKLSQKFSRTKRHILRRITIRCSFSEPPISLGSIRTLSGDNLEFKQKKPGND